MAFQLFSVGMCHRTKSLWWFPGFLPVLPSKSHTDSNSSGQDPPRRRLRTPSSPGSSPQGARRSSPPRNHTAGWRPNRPCLKFYTGKQRMSPSKGGGGLLGRNRGEGYPPVPQHMFIFMVLLLLSYFSCYKTQHLSWRRFQLRYRGKQLRGDSDKKYMVDHTHKLR